MLFSYQPLIRQRGPLCLYLALITVAAICCSAGCRSANLNRSRAADLIQASEEFRRPMTITLLPAYRQTLTLIGTGSREMPREEFALRRFYESRAELAVLHHLGLVEFRVTNIQNPHSAATPVTISSALTERGQQAARQWQQAENGWVIPLARRELIEVTGLTGGEGDSRTARAEYTWRWQPTEAGTTFDTSNQAHQSLPDSIRQNFGGASFADMLRNRGQTPIFDSSRTQVGEVTPQRYDDGWRVTSVRERP